MYAFVAAAGAPAPGLDPTTWPGFLSLLATIVLGYYTRRNHTDVSAAQGQADAANETAVKTAEWRARAEEKIGALEGGMSALESRAQDYENVQTDSRGAHALILEKLENLATGQAEIKQSVKDLTEESRSGRRELHEKHERLSEKVHVELGARRGKGD